MDVTESIRKRRFHRSFTDEPVDEEALAQLVWAAGRAPMGGNELVRRIVVVADPAVMRTVRQVTPSFLANAPAVPVICTDLERAGASMGIQGRHVLCLAARARDCLGEPVIDGPVRMIEGVSRMLEGQASDGFLTEMKAAIDREKYSVMADRAAFARWVDDLLRDFAAEAGRRNAPAFKPAAPAIEGEKR